MAIDTEENQLVGAAGEYVNGYRTAPQDLEVFNALSVGEKLGVIGAMPYYQATVLLSDQYYVAEGYWKFGPHPDERADMYRQRAVELVMLAEGEGWGGDLVRKFPRLSLSQERDAYFEDFGVMVGGRQVGRVRQQLYWDTHVCQYFNPDARWPDVGVVAANNLGEEYDLFGFLPSKKVYHVPHGHPGAYPTEVESVGFQSHLAIYRFMHEGCHQLEEQMLVDMGLDPELARRAWRLMQGVLEGSVGSGVIRNVEVAQTLVEFDQQPWLKSLELWRTYCRHLGVSEDSMLVQGAREFAGSAMAMMMNNILVATDPKLHDKLLIDSAFVHHPEMIQVMNKKEEHEAFNFSQRAEW